LSRLNFRRHLNSRTGPDLTDAQKRGVLAENGRQLYRLR
jgi:hypothetical protein